MNTVKRLTLQIHLDNRWLDAGEISFRTPSEGLRSQMSFYYKPSYLDSIDCLADSIVTDHRAATVNASASLTQHYDERMIGPFLRDIMPHGFARRVLLRWGKRDSRTGSSRDFELLSSYCVSPVGNIRVKEAAQRFSETIGQHSGGPMSVGDIVDGREALSEIIKSTPLTILAGALGAGGEAPKLLVVEDECGGLHLEGSIPQSRIRKHWLVKFPRGRASELDQDILRAEGAFYAALCRCGINTILGAKLVEGRTPTLWLPRFDRSIQQRKEYRAGVESMYCLNGMIGDGAKMYHEDVLASLKRVTTPQVAFDDVLCDYLIRDVINYAVGNSDNHGRNTSILKGHQDIRLSPAYDIAPMVLDSDGISRATVWSRKSLKGLENPNYRTIIREFSSNPEATLKNFKTRLVGLCSLDEEAHKAGVPARVTRHRKVDFKRPEKILTDLIL